MKITGLEINGYGVWSGLKLEGMADGLNVLYGPNEAGKTTLLQFVRSMLYGFSPERRKYLPPIRGGRPGGQIDLAGPSGSFCLDRHDDRHDDAGRERFTLTAADGARQGEHLLRVLLCEVDEAIYNNVFAVGLRELQELGTLSDTEAADSLYSLSAGLDRVSLVEVMRELETSRNRILDRNGGPCQVAQLLELREKLRLEIEELGASTGRYARLATQRNQIELETRQLEEKNNRADRDARVVELAITLRDRWNRRAELDNELATLGPTAIIPDGAIDRLDDLNTRLQQHQQQAEQLQQQREQIRTEAADLGINQALWRQAARIEALREQETWITTLQSRIAELEREIGELEAGLDTEREQLGLSNRIEPDRLPTVSARTLSMLRPKAKALRLCRQRVIEARQQVATVKETAKALAQQIETALSAGNHSDLATALDGAGNLVAQLRRRLQTDGRIEEMTRYQRELEDQSRRLIGRQMLPVWVLAGMGAAFVLGVVLLMAGLFMPASITGSVGWAMTLLGLAGSVAAGLGKVMLERSNARRLETCQKQINRLQLQVQQARQERDELDRQLPPGGGPLGNRLPAAEKELAALEELVPLDGRRTAVVQEAHAAAGRVNLAESKLAAATGHWRKALFAVGLPDNLSPGQVRQLTQRCDHFGQLHRRLAHRREEIEQRRRELDSLLGRITQLAADTGVDLSGLDPAEQIRRLAAALGQQETRFQRREALRQEARQLQRKRAKHHKAARRIKQRRHELLYESGARNEREFRARALQVARAEVLQRERDSLAGEITAAIGGCCSEDAIGKHLEGNPDRQLEARRDELLDRLEMLEKELKERFEKRGRLAEQLKALADDRQMAVKQLELATIERRLEEAISRWRVLTVTSQTLENIRTVYEQQRQPETLQEASGYLDRLTCGRYRRVWTPLGEDVLRVDDAEGNSLAVEALSRGTREQLFLALRLALAGSYARRGAQLPLVLDDVLVNFDADRAKAAATVLRDFAAAGHQLLVFTCHEHILKLFKSLKVPVSRLPANTEAEPTPVAFVEPPKPKRKRTKKAALPPEEPELPEEVDEPDEEGIFEPSEEDTPWDEEETDDDEEDEWEEAEDEDEGYENEYEYENDDDAAEAA